MLPTLDDIGGFASSAVLDSLRERYDDGLFSRDIWRSMGEMGLFGMTVREDLGGRGGEPRFLARALSRFAGDGCDMGLTLSWITHLALCIKSIELFGTERQRKDYLDRLIAGEWVGGAAISEPKAGAHPAGIETTATKSGSGYSLDGTKLYITDGPVADLLVVIAATGELADGKKELTAFLVETDTPGFSAAPMDLNFVKTSPHAMLTFDGVEVDANAVLGEIGAGHSMASKSAFARERAMVVAAGAGLFGAAAQAAAAGLVKKAGSFDVEAKEGAAWIHHMAALAAYSHLSADLIDTAYYDFENWREAMDLLIYMGISYASWGAWLGDFVVRHQLEPSFPLDIMLNDMKLILIGERMLFKEGRKRYILPYE
ncbi:MAG: acyl-CoA dehydrogenase family protein [Candidatus Geothermincolia bacterium]